jgi:23S rRNA pseudouridine1911/1915/1917 synthase
MPEKLKILFEDNHLLVVDKPPLLATMGVGDDKPSLLKLAREYIRETYHKPGNVYLGVVSRLDAFASGAIIFAKTSKCASRISAQLRAGTIDKTYWAIVPSGLPASEGVLQHWIAKDDSRHRMIAFDRPEDHAKLARLHYRTLGRTDSECLLQIKLETGRKHQIRVQFSHAGTPVVGDQKYGSRQPFETGIALHCRSLQFEHPTRKTPMNVDSPPPNWWKIDRFGIS